MRLSFRLKNFFFNAFREIFVHHHGSLEFRAKIFALIIASNEEIKDEHYTIAEEAGVKIYGNDEDRVSLLMLSIKELVKKVKDDNGLNIDTLVSNIQQDLKFAPRYAKKIDIQSLEPFLNLSHDKDIIAYQKNILEFLNNLKNETLLNKKTQIAEDEKQLNAK